MFTVGDFIKIFNESNGTSYRKAQWIDDSIKSLEEEGIVLSDLIAYVRKIAVNDLGYFLACARTEILDKRGSIKKEAAGMEFGMLEKALSKVMIDEYAPQIAETMYTKIDDYIEDNYGTITKVVHYHSPERGGELNEVTHEKFETVLNFVNADEPVMLVGPTGTGKNVICKQIAKLLGLEFYFSNAITQEHKLTGFIDANGNFHETQFYKAFKNGGLFMLDEVDASIPEVLVILNAAIANRYFDFPNGKIEAHPDFRVVAAANTFGTGASYIYSGRNQLDGASLDRFAVVYIDYSKRIEDAISQDTDLLNFIREFREICTTCGINHIVSYRSLMRLEKLKEAMNMGELLKTCLLKNLENDDINIIVGEFDKKYDDSKYIKGLREVAKS